MNCKRFISGISAFAIAASSFAAMTITASAEYSTDPITGAITWTFNTPATTQPTMHDTDTPTAHSDNAGTYYYTYEGETVSGLTECTDSDAKAAIGNVLGMSFQTNSGNKWWNGSVGGGSFVSTYVGQAQIFYAPAQSGIMTITASKSASDKKCNLYVNGTEKELTTTSADYTFTCTANTPVTIKTTGDNGSNRGSITKIKFTPTTEKGFTFDIKASEVSGKTLYLKVGDKPETSAVIPETTIFSGEGDVGIAFIISGIPAGLDVSARIE